MYGAIIGDVIGSTYEYEEIKTKDFPLFPEGSEYTDDTILTVAVASALLLHLQEGRDFRQTMVEEMRRFCRLYPNPLGAYGIRFQGWLWDPSARPYHSCGNGSAMRVSPCALAARSLTQALDLAEQSADVTHDHPEGIKGAQATAAAIYLARTGSTKEEIRNYIRENFYSLDRTLAQIRPQYRFDGTCQGSVPQSIQAFLESDSYEDAIRNVISLGGDADTMGAITGAIAWAYYGRDGIQPDMERMLSQVWLPQDLQQIVDDFINFLTCRFPNDQE